MLLPTRGHGCSVFQVRSEHWWRGHGGHHGLIWRCDNDRIIRWCQCSWWGEQCRDWGSRSCPWRGLNRDHAVWRGSVRERRSRIRNRGCSVRDWRSRCVDQGRLHRDWRRRVHLGHGSRWRSLSCWRLWWQLWWFHMDCVRGRYALSAGSIACRDCRGCLLIRSV